MNFAKLNKRIKLQERSLTLDSMGGQDESFVDVATTWANVSPLKGNSLFFAQQRDSKTDTKITMRYRDDIQPDWKIKFETTIYRITAIVNPESDKNILEVFCEALRHEKATGTVTAPIITSPANEAIDVSVTPVIEASAFITDTREDIHRSTQWQIALAEDLIDWTAPVVDTTSTTEKETLTIAAGILSPDTTYQVRVRYMGTSFGNSEWSEPITFTTAE